jgi:hypothetical protein
MVNIKGPMKTQVALGSRKSEVAISYMLSNVTLYFLQLLGGGGWIGSIRLGADRLYGIYLYKLLNTGGEGRGADREWDICLHKLLNTGWEGRGADRKWDICLH